MKYVHNFFRAVVYIFLFMTGVFFIFKAAIIERDSLTGIVSVGIALFAMAVLRMVQASAHQEELLAALSNKHNPTETP